MDRCGASCAGWTKRQGRPIDGPVGWITRVRRPIAGGRTSAPCGLGAGWKTQAPQSRVQGRETCATCRARSMLRRTICVRVAALAGVAGPILLDARRGGERPLVADRAGQGRRRGSCRTCHGTGDGLGCVVSARATIFRALCTAPLPLESVPAEAGDDLALDERLDPMAPRPRRQRDQPAAVVAQVREVRLDLPTRRKQPTQEPIRLRQPVDRLDAPPPRRLPRSRRTGWQPRKRRGVTSRWPPWAARSCSLLVS